ncbi:MAG: YdgA family protein [Comamonas sp.]
MSNKKTIVAAAVALAVVAYGGATWYTGEQAEAGYREAVAELRKALGDKTIVADEYHKGFFSSQAQLVLQGEAPEADDADEAEAEPAAPIRLVIDTTVYHGPFAGGRLASAASESRFALQGLDDKSRQALAKATAPTLTSVHHFTGSRDVQVLLPAGEISDKQVTMRWQELVLDTTFKGDRAKGNLRWPELALLGLSSGSDADDEDGDDGDDLADSPTDRTTITLKGMDGSFESQSVDGLWGLGPGSTQLRLAQLGIQKTAAEGGDAQTLADLKQLSAQSVIEADQATLSMTTQVKGTGRIGPLDLESVGYEEKYQRLDIETLRKLQQVVADGYRKEGLAKAMESLQEQGAELLLENAPRLVAALPAYSMKLQATYQGQTGELAYGGEVRKAPSAEQVQAAGWLPALLQTSAVQANARLPKAWIAPMLKASGNAEATDQDAQAMVEMAEKMGYGKAEGDFLTSAFSLNAGQATLNGKPFRLPAGALQ